MSEAKRTDTGTRRRGGMGGRGRRGRRRVGCQSELPTSIFTNDTNNEINTTQRLNDRVTGNNESQGNEINVSTGGTTDGNALPVGEGRRGRV